MKFEGTLESVCDYLEITPVLSDKIRELLSKIKVTNIECDSRRVTKGTIYYAKKGAHFNPFEHLEEIKSKGAVAILVDAPVVNEEQDGWQSVLNYAQVGYQIKPNIDNDNSPEIALDNKDNENDQAVSQKVRSGRAVVTRYCSDPVLAQKEYIASQETQEAKAIAEAKMLRLVLPSNKSLSALAGFIYGNPSEKLRLIGVTGTNGKSTITSLIAQMLNRCGHKCALFGTLGYGFLDDLKASANTTLDAISLQRELAHYVQLGADYAVMEVSSIGFCQGRVSGLSFFAGAFSNLSRDHLDYHQNMGDYFASKLNFLKMIPPKYLAVNCNTPEGAKICSEINGCYKVTIQSSEAVSSISSQINVQNIKYESSYTELAISVGAKKTLNTKLGLLGRFNVENFALALGVLASMDYDIKFLMRNASKLKPITGRMECFCLPEKPRLIVDYAHTPDGVEQALLAARSHTDGNGRIFAIIGCGGDRDMGKRPIMALKSSVYADYAIFTADNPRSENLDNIIADMLLGVATEPSESLRYDILDKYSQLALLWHEHNNLVTKALDKISTTNKAKFNSINNLFALAMNKGLCFEELNTELEIQGHESKNDLFYEQVSEYLTKVLHLCAKSFSFEQYDNLRIKYDKTIFNQALKGAYYQAHQEIFGMPTCLIKDKEINRNVFIIKDRYQAIRFAFEHANKNDCVLIAGKGHEDYQIFADMTIHFSDRQICCELLGINEDGSLLNALNLLDRASDLEKKSDPKASVKVANSSAKETVTKKIAKITKTQNKASSAFKSDLKKESKKSNLNDTIGKSDSKQTSKVAKITKVTKEKTKSAKSAKGE